MRIDFSQSIDSRVALQGYSVVGGNIGSYTADFTCYAIGTSGSDGIFSLDVSSINTAKYIIVRITAGATTCNASIVVKQIWLE
jgi:hypothetical protein